MKFARWENTKKEKATFVIVCMIYSWKMTQSRFKELSEQSGVFNEKSLEFQNLIMERSGLGNDTSLPPGDRISLAALG